MKPLRAMLLTAAICGAGNPALAGIMTYFKDGGDGFAGLIDPDLIAGPNPGINNLGRPGTANSAAGYQVFVDALGPGVMLGIEDFEDKGRTGFAGVNPTNNPASTPVSLNLRFDPSPSMTISATLTGDDGQVAKLTDPTRNSAGRFPVSVPVGGEQYFDTNFALLDFTIDFGTTPVGAFGFFATDAGDFNGQIELLLGFAGGGMQTVSVPHLRTPPPPDMDTETFINTSLLFFGLTSDDAIKTVTFANTFPQFGDRFGIDNIVVAATQSEVPEPCSALLLGLGAISVAGRRSVRRWRSCVSR
jgi:hypothetical protein